MNIGFMTNMPEMKWNEMYHQLPEIDFNEPKNMKTKIWDK
jgi:hypothetical protein